MIDNIQGRYTDFPDSNVAKLTDVSNGIPTVPLPHITVQQNPPRISVLYHDPELVHIEQTKNGDWIDLRAAEDVEMKAGEFRIISLGVSMLLPDGYEAHIVPRSSTYKRWHILQTNSMGIIDNSYSGPNDIWGFPALAMQDTVIHKNDRICQFRIVPTMSDVSINPVKFLTTTDRGGFGSTGAR